MITLRTIKARSKLAPRGKPYFVATAAPGISLGYRRIEGRAGSWCARVADGQGGNRFVKLRTVADDYVEDNGREIMSFERASDAARKVNGNARAEGRLTVARAIEEYEAGNRGRHAGNVSRVRYWIGQAAPGLLAKEVSALTSNELKAWRDGIKAAPATVNRTIRIMKAALNGLAEAYPDQVTNTTAWQIGLKQKPHKHQANNNVLSDDQVRDLVRAAYDVDPAFGRFVEVGAVTGARPSQVERLEVGDLQLEPAPRLMMPTSLKGTGNKDSHIAVPITADLAGKLAQSSVGRGPSEPLLQRAKGDAWSASSADYRRPFEQAVKGAGLDKHPRKVTYYALRHSSIVRRIKLNRTPLQTIAKIHDTSVAMIERNYARYIHLFDESARLGLLDLGVPARNNVVALRA